MSTIDIELERADRIYQPGDLVKGEILVDATSGWSHQGIAMKVEGSIKLQTSTKSVGILDSFYNTVKPLDLVYFHIPIAPPGKVEQGMNKFPFQFELIGIDKQILLETYHGVYVKVIYEISCDCIRGIMKRKLHSIVEFIVEAPLKEVIEGCSQSFSATPQTLENVRSLSKIPNFHITGKIHRTNCYINTPFTGEVVVESASAKIKSIEVQLIRVETVGVTREATEIQNVQIVHGDVCRNLAIPIYMIFPRLFTCPTMITEGFKVEFETNVVILFEDGYMITENFPINLYR